jgi:hypothetical protein
MAPPLTAHNLTVQTASYFGKGGTISNVERVTFYVGAHGPFTLDFAAGQDNTLAIQQAVNAKVQQLQTLQSMYGG